MIISHTHKFIFFCNGKTGTTSIEHALAQYQEGEELDISSPGLFYKKHVPPLMLRSLLPSAIWQDYYKFVFVRNPWDWVVSNWKYNFEYLPKIRSRKHGLIRRIKKFHRGQAGIYRTQYRDKLSVDDVSQLHDYLRAVRIIPTEPTCSQWPYVYDMDGIPIVDFVGRFETIENDFKKISEDLGLSIDLPLLNQTAHKPYMDYYTDASRNAVAKIWARDISLFNYDFL